MNKRHMPFGGMESSVDMARALMLISQHGFSFGAGAAAPAAGFLPVHARVFECKTCNRQFSTFQALGGHRASHKRPRLRALGDVDGDGAGLCLGLQPPQKPPRAAGPRVHECPVCGRRFAAGQALGGHMRRHRAEGDADAHDAAVGAAKAGEIGGICLDLNLTPSENCAKCRSVHKAVAILDSSL